MKGTGPPRSYVFQTALVIGDPELGRRDARKHFKKQREGGAGDSWTLRTQRGKKECTEHLEKHRNAEQGPHGEAVGAPEGELLEMLYWRARAHVSKCDCTAQTGKSWRRSCFTAE